MYECLYVCPRAYLEEEWSDQVENYSIELIPSWLGPSRFLSKSDKNGCHGNGKCEKHIIGYNFDSNQGTFSQLFLYFSIVNSRSYSVWPMAVRSKLPIIAQCRKFGGYDFKVFWSYNIEDHIMNPVINLS